MKAPHIIDIEDFDDNELQQILAADGDKELVCIVRPAAEHIHFEVLIDKKKYEFSHLECAVRKYNETRNLSMSCSTSPLISSCLTSR